MELSVNRSNARREERWPLDVLIELGNEDGEEMLEADGLDLSPHGMAMRASFVPPVGAPMRCQFRCPPQGEPVRVEGEVVWSEWTGPRVGAFGIRFSALDTQSATAIRRYVEPEHEEVPPEPAHEPVATLNIDGLGAPIEAEVRLSDEGRVVLEQELAFLKLGRGVEVDVPGRGKQRGRIGSIDLRHNHLDVPTLVFGILLDEVARPTEVALPVSALLTTPFAVVSDDEDGSLDAAPVAIAPDEARAFAASEEPSVDTWPERPVFADASPPVGTPSAEDPELDPSPFEKVAARVAPRKKRDEPMREAVREPVMSSEERASLRAEAGKTSVSPAVLAGASAMVAWFVRLRALFVPLWANLVARVESLRGDAVPQLKARLTALWDKLQGLVQAQVERFQAARAARAEQRSQRAAAAPQPRVQRVQGAREPAAREHTGPREHAAPREQGAPREQAVRPRGPSNKQRRLAAIALAAAGVALGVYALAPRSGADRIRTPRESARPQPVVAVQTAPVAPAPSFVAPVAEPVAPVAAPTSDAAAKVFGMPEVPNGRSFVLRMSGPVDEVEGDMREDGFTVRVPGRLALDRASPIATSHRAVARAMILNRGDYAELTVDFLPGMRPKYQVVGKENTIEVTLERQ